MPYISDRTGLPSTLEKVNKPWTDLAVMAASTYLLSMPFKVATWVYFDE